MRRRGSLTRNCCVLTHSCEIFQESTLAVINMAKIKYTPKPKKTASSLLVKFNIWRDLGLPQNLITHEMRGVRLGCMCFTHGFTPF